MKISHVFCYVQVWALFWRILNLKLKKITLRRIPKAKGAWMAQTESLTTTGMVGVSRTARHTDGRWLRLVKPYNFHEGTWRKRRTKRRRNQISSTVHHLERRTPPLRLLEICPRGYNKVVIIIFLVHDIKFMFHARIVLTGNIVHVWFNKQNTKSLVRLYLTSSLIKWWSWFPDYRHELSL